MPNPAAAPPERRFLLGMILSVGLVPLNSTMIAVALPEIGADLGFPGSELGHWLVSTYLIAAIVGQSPAGKIGDLWGHRRAMEVGRWLFFLGTLLGCLFPGLYLLVAARILMAVGGSLLTPTALALLRNRVPAHRRGRMFGLFGSITALAGALGPVLGGWLTQHLGWESIFWINIPVVLLSQYLVLGQVVETPEHGPKGRPRFDLAGSVLLGVGLVSLVVAIDSIGWEGGFSALLWIGALFALIGFYYFERGVESPVLDFALFRHRDYRIATGLTCLVNFGIYGVLFQVPFLYEEVYRMDPARVGVALMGMMLGMVVFSPVGGRLADRHGAAVVVCSGSLLAFAGMQLLALSRFWPDPVQIIPFTALVGMGMGFCIGPCQAVALGAVEPGESGMASGVMTMLRLLGSMVGIATLSLLMARRTLPLMEHFMFGFRFYSLPFLAMALLALALPGGKQSGAGSRA